MNPLVRDLYRRVLIVGRDYPGGFKFQDVPQANTCQNVNCKANADGVKAGWTRCGGRQRSVFFKIASSAMRLTSSAPSQEAGSAPHPNISDDVMCLFCLCLSPYLSQGIIVQLSLVENCKKSATRRR